MTEAVNTNIEDTRSDELKIDEANIGDLSGAPSSTFPQKLFAMSMQEFDEGEVIHWLPHGLAFKVVDSDKFSEEVIPKYFKHTKLTSFQRQLNLYGFRRITKGDDHGAYFHPNFQRGRRDLISCIRRLPSKTNRFSMDSFSSDTLDTTNGKYAGLSLAECEVTDECEMPPKKKISTHSEDSCADNSCVTFFNLSGLKSDAARFSEIPSSVNQTRRSTNNNSGKAALGLSVGSHSSAHSGYPTSPPLPTMSKLTMNIGYTKHLPTSIVAQDNKNHNLAATAGQAILEPSQYTSYNLLSNKRLNGNGPMGVKDTLPVGNGQIIDPFSYQQAQRELRATLAQPAVTDYPALSPSLNSMYANSTNSSSITDFKLLMAQTSTSDFSNWNDGTIWQPRAISHNSSSSNSLFSEDESFQQSHDYDENFDEIPSFDEAMDMIMSSK